MSPKAIGVIITTYNSPDWLDKVLTGYEQQTMTEFRTIVADDGSTDDTRSVISRYAARGKLQIDHVWHDDLGFRKCAILNKAIAGTGCDYLIFTDGDCIPDPDFVSVHAAEARPRCFLSGGYIKLSMPVSESITTGDIRSGQVFDRRWLIERGQPANHKLWKLIRSSAFRRIMNRLTPTRATWNGMNSSTWTEEILAVNGFNEDMQYGGLDRELGERLWNNGVSSRQIRYSAVCLHLDHPRGYANAETRARNDAIRRDVRRQHVVWTQNGIVKE